MMTKLNGIFENIVEFPDAAAMRRFASLVGLDDTKELLLKEAMLLADATILEKWSRSHYGEHVAIAETFRERHPLFIFAGDVGCGKTALAESFGDALARKLDLPVVLYSLSLTARGTGAVGEMTSLISTAFSEFVTRAREAKGSNGRPRCVYILLIDEADALAQSRESAQMHHEDRAGVNAIIRGIDNLARERVPAIGIMCTNRLAALDPAIQRRASEIFRFDRPNEVRRRQILASALSAIGFGEGEIEELVRITGITRERKLGYTFSDLTQRFLPRLVLDAFPDRRITFDRAKQIALQFAPTPVFRQQENNDQN